MRKKTEQCLSATGAESRCSRNGSTMVCLTRKHWMVGRLKRGTSLELATCARSASKCTAKRWIVFMKVADMEGKTDNSQKKEEHDSLKPARDAITTAMRAAQFAKATGTPLPKPLKWQREFYDATGVFPYGWYECPVCGYRTDWEPHACPICHTLLEP